MERYNKAKWRASVRNGQIPASKLARVEPIQFDPDLARRTTLLAGN